MALNSNSINTWKSNICKAGAVHTLNKFQESLVLFSLLQMSRSTEVGFIVQYEGDRVYKRRLYGDLSLLNNNDRVLKSPLSRLNKSTFNIPLFFSPLGFGIEAVLEEDDLSKEVEALLGVEPQFDLIQYFILWDTFYGVSGFSFDFMRH